MTFSPPDGLADITREIIAAAIAVHDGLGPGLLESAYQRCLEYEMTQRGTRFRPQVPVPLNYEDVRLDCGYRVDLLVDDKVIVEVKAVETLAPIHRAQMITYLKLTRCPVGLLLNFNVTSMKKGIRRLTNKFEQRTNAGWKLLPDLPDVPV